MATIITIPNGGFEEGNLDDWTVLEAGSGAPPEVTSEDRAPFEGTYGLAVRSDLEIVVQNDEFFSVVPGDSVTVECMIMPTRGSDRGTVRIWWFDQAGTPITPAFEENAYGTPGHVRGTGGYRKSSLTRRVPSTARSFKVGAYVRKYTHSAFGIDSFKGAITSNSFIRLVLPEDGSEYGAGDTVRLSAEVAIYTAGGNLVGGGDGGDPWDPIREDQQEQL